MLERLSCPCGEVGCVSFRDRNDFVFFFKGNLLLCTLELHVPCHELGQKVDIVLSFACLFTDFDILVAWVNNANLPFHLQFDCSRIVV